MSIGFLKVLITIQVIALLALYALTGWMVYMGAWVSGGAFAFIATMMAEPWTLRWPRDERNAT